VKPQVNSFSGVPDDVLSSRVSGVPLPHKLMHLVNIEWGYDLRKGHVLSNRPRNANLKIEFKFSFIRKRNNCELYPFTWSIARFGSGVMTVLAEKSTRFPIKFPLIRPSFPLSLALIAFSGRPDFCMAFGKPMKKELCG
jgi:hypothetical protein